MFIFLLILVIALSSEDKLLLLQDSDSNSNSEILDLLDPSTSDKIVGKIYVSCSVEVSHV